MFNWVVKVVPHPSGAQDAPGESTPVNGKTTNQERVKSSKPAGEEDQASQTSQGSVQSGMLNWLSSGFASTLPQPAGSPLITRATDFKGDERPGVIGWISQGIGKVVPQPDIYEKYTREQTPESEEVTEVYDINDLPDLEPLPHIPVVELLSEDEDEEDTRTTPTVATWIKNGFQNAMPHHVPRPPSGSVPSTPRSSQCSNKIYSPPPESIASVTELDANPPSVVGWIVHGLGLSMPQPVLKLRDEYLDDGKMLHNGDARPVPADLVLEEVNSEDEAPADACQPLEPSLPASITTPTQAHIELEDAETQTARWTPMMESIRREAEDHAILLMEERLIQERIAMARMAEEVARQTAEMAVRELAQARLGIQTIPEEPEDVDQELQVLQEEESEYDLTRNNTEQCPAPEEEKAEGPEVETPVEPFKCSSPITDKPTGEGEDLGEEEESGESEDENSPITQQPQSLTKSSASQTDTPFESTADEGESSVPSRCDALKTCLMPYTSRAQDRFNQFLDDYDITLPKVPSIPSLPPAVTQLSQHLPPLPPQLAHLQQQFSQIPQQISQRISQIPQQFSNPSQSIFSVPQVASLPLQLSSLPQQLSKIPQRLTSIPTWFSSSSQGEPSNSAEEPSSAPPTETESSIPENSVSQTSISQRISNIPQKLCSIPQTLYSIPQKLSNIPQKISQIPQSAQQYYANIQNRLNKLKPDHDGQGTTEEE